jgi:preprotein translocase subunit SecD
MNQYPVWKYVLISVLMVLGVVLALPNLYGEDPALLISPPHGTHVDAALQSRVETLVKETGLTPKRSELTASGLLVRFGDADAQLKAKDAVEKGLGEGYTVALNLAPATPGWLNALGVKPMYLGLDLRGGVHFLMEVDMQSAIAKADERYVNDLRTLLREADIRYRGITQRPNGGGVDIQFRDAASRDRAYAKVHETNPELVLTETDNAGEPGLHAVLSEKAVRETREFALKQNITTLRNRVNELGVAEPVIQQQGDNRIVVQLPGVQDTARAKDILGATATLEFRAVDEEHDLGQAMSGRVPPGSRIYHERNGRPVLLKKRVIVTGDQLTNAASGLDQRSATPMVTVSLDSKGGRMMGQFTKDNIGKRMAVVFIEHKVESKKVDGKRVTTTHEVEEVINVAVIRDAFSNRFQITGLDSTEEARDLALLLRAGALAAPVFIVEERTVGPSLGQQNIEQGFKSVVIGFVTVLVFMAVRYRVFGLVANLALGANLVLIVAVLSMLQATLTMPGIAGIVLTVGMAVDANVLIFERIREELRNGNSPQASIHAGYEKAFSTIADANITTLIAALVLFGFGTGPIKGFAITLSIGVMTSMFTAIMGTRAVINASYGGRRLSGLRI